MGTSASVSGGASYWNYFEKHGYVVSRISEHLFCFVQRSYVECFICNLFIFILFVKRVKDSVLMLDSPAVAGYPD